MPKKIKDPAGTYPNVGLSGSVVHPHHDDVRVGHAAVGRESQADESQGAHLHPERDRLLVGAP